MVNPDIEQIVEIRPEADRFLRLLEVLGEWYGRGKMIIFVQSQVGGGRGREGGEGRGGEGRGGWWIFNGF